MSDHRAVPAWGLGRGVLTLVLSMGLSCADVLRPPGQAPAFLLVRTHVRATLSASARSLSSRAAEVCAGGLGSAVTPPFHGLVSLGSF